MRLLSFLLVSGVLFVSFAEAALSNRDVETLFEGKRKCTNVGSSFDISYYDLDKEFLSHEMPYLTKEKTAHAFRECIQMPKDLSTVLTEKDECHAYVLVFPRKLKREEARHVFSGIHAHPDHAQIVVPLFDPAVSVVRSNKAKWKALAADYAGIRKSLDSASNETTTKLVEAYAKTYATLKDAYLAKYDLTKEDLHFAKIPWAGCH